MEQGAWETLHSPHLATEFTYMLEKQHHAVKDAVSRALMLVCSACEYRAGCHKTGVHAVAASSDAGLGLYTAAAHTLWHPHQAAQALSFLPGAAYAA